MDSRCRACRWLSLLGSLRTTTVSSRPVALRRVQFASRGDRVPVDGNAVAAGTLATRATRASRCAKPRADSGWRRCEGAWGRDADRGPAQAMVRRLDLGSFLGAGTFS